MSAITTRPFRLLTDIQTVWDFLTGNYAPGFANGAAAPFFEYAVTSTWMDKNYTHLYRFWLDGSKPAAFVFAESPVTDVYFCLNPAYAFLADELIAYADAVMPDFGGMRQFILFNGQQALADAARRHGYVCCGGQDEWMLDFAKGSLHYELPDGFRFMEPAETDPVKLAECTWKGFGHEDKGPFTNWTEPNLATAWSPHLAWLNIAGQLTAPPPHATNEHNVIIADEKGDYVCYSGMWWVPENHLAYMEPLCTVPAYHRKGLAAAALTRHYRVLKALGAEYMTGGADPFYRAIGFNNCRSPEFFQKSRKITRPKERKRHAYIQCRPTESNRCRQSGSAHFGSGGIRQNHRDGEQDHTNAYHASRSIHLAVFGHHLYQ